MPRIARAVAVDCGHHITQRGNNRQDIFFVDDDWLVYLELLSRQCNKYALDIVAYCLMTNHIHLVVIPRRKDSLANAIGRTAFRYTQYINRMHKRSGHLWQGRFYSCALDERGLFLATKYVELNPIRARICRAPWRYKWSSAAVHIDPTAKSDRLNLEKWYDMISAKQWRKELKDGLDETTIEKIRLSTHTGRPLGTDSFISKVEKLLGRRVRPLPIGRPQKRKRVDNKKFCRHHR